MKPSTVIQLISVRQKFDLLQQSNKLEGTGGFMVLTLNEMIIIILELAVNITLLDISVAEVYTETYLKHHLKS